MEKDLDEHLATLTNPGNSPSARVLALSELSGSGDSRVAEALRSILDDPYDRNIHGSAMDLLGRLGNKEKDATRITNFALEHPGERDRAAKALLNLHMKELDPHSVQPPVPVRGR